MGPGAWAASDQPAPPAAPTLSVRGVVNRFAAQVVHDGVSLDVFAGEVLGIVGGSGSGKSVLLRTMLGLHRPTAGEVLVEGRTTLEGWARALELRDRETEGHTRRVTMWTLELARFMGVSDKEMVNIYRGVLLHDIGKMGVPDRILNKTRRLDEEEWKEMRQHPVYAFNLLSAISYLRGALDIPYCHHEHWDSSGYPRGLKGEQIPLPARIFSVIDIWDALLSDRPYRKAWPVQKVASYLKEVSGTILDPSIVEIFFNMIESKFRETD